MASGLQIRTRPNYRIPDIEKDSDDNVYYNINIQPRTEKVIRADYNRTRRYPILDDPSKYELTVVSYNVPTSDIPLLVWGDAPYDPVTNPSSKVDKYAVYLEYEGVVVEKKLEWIANINPATGQDLYGKAVWTYNEFLNILNTAFNNAYLDLIALKPLAPVTSPITFLYNPTRNNLIEFVAEAAGYRTGIDPVGNPPVVEPVKIFVNDALYKFFPSLTSIYNRNAFSPALDDTFQLIVWDTGVNETIYKGITSYAMVQEYPTVGLWADLTNIVFETNVIPIEPELGQNPKIGNAEPEGDTTRRLISDFIPIEGILDREIINYRAVGYKRYYDMKSKFPLSQIDLNVFWADEVGTLYPVYITQGDSLQVKLLFRKKYSEQVRKANKNDNRND